jgi:Xaa-Pro aminopeptidase
MTEVQLEAELTYEFMRNGARFPAYGSIVGSGPNACVLHYVRNDRKLRKGDLVLIDAGCEYEHYAADLTRTFPAAGQFSKAQQAIYEIVLAANAAGIAACVPGASFAAPHDAAVRVMVQGLVDLKLLRGGLDELIETEAYRVFSPHKTSHWLGIDVHDVGDYRIDDTWRELEPGMVLTVEPGIYLAGPAAAALPARYRNLGVRIEDDVLVTRSKPEVLTNAAPKAVSDVERVVGHA